MGLFSMMLSCWDKLGRSSQFSIVARWFPPDSMLARVSGKNLTRAMLTLKSVSWNEMCWPGAATASRSARLPPQVLVPGSPQARRPKGWGSPEKP